MVNDVINKNKMSEASGSILCIFYILQIINLKIYQCVCIVLGKHQILSSVTKQSPKNHTPTKLSIVTPYHSDYSLPNFIILDANSQNPFEVLNRSCDFCQIPKPIILYDKTDALNM